MQRPLYSALFLLALLSASVRFVGCMDVPTAHPCTGSPTNDRAHDTIRTVDEGPIGNP